MFIKPSEFVEMLNLQDKIVIKDYFTGRVFVVDQYPKINILKDALSGIEIETLKNNYKDDFSSFWNELIKLGLVELSKSFNYYSEELSFGGIIPKFYSGNSKKDIRNIIINIGGECNKDCTFCNKGVEKVCLACTYNPNLNKMNYDLKVLKKFLIDIIENNNKRPINITFSGFVNNKNIRFMSEVAEELKNKNISFLLITPEFEISKEITEFLNNNSTLIYFQIINKESLNFYNLLCEDYKVIPILRINDKHIIEEFDNKNVCYIKNFEISNLIKDNNFRGDSKYFLGVPLLENKIIKSAALSCLFGRLYIDCNGDIYTCELHESVGNINCNKTGLLTNLWKDYTNHLKDVESCLYCQYRSDCDICIYNNKKYSFLKCEYDMTSDVK